MIEPLNGDSTSFTANLNLVVMKAPSTLRDFKLKKNLKTSGKEERIKKGGKGADAQVGGKIDMFLEEQREERKEQR